MKPTRILTILGLIAAVYMGMIAVASAVELRFDFRDGVVVVNDADRGPNCSFHTDNPKILAAIVALFESDLEDIDVFLNQLMKIIGTPPSPKYIPWLYNYLERRCGLDTKETAS
jgi:hypothetical protein